MKVGIIGGGISGLSTAYYIQKLGLPVSEIIIYEASSKFGGWIDSKKISYKDDEVYFEKGPRTLRIATGELKELNSLQLASDLGMGSKIELIPKTHPASLNRYIYSNDKINAVSASLFKKSEILPKRLISYLWNEFTAPKRSDQVEDESIWSFIARRLSPDVADNLVDPLFKGICGGDIKTLSAATMVKNFYEFEKEKGSIIKGALSRDKSHELLALEEQFKELVEQRENFKNQSVWRVETGMSDLINKMVEKLADNEVRLLLNEPVQSLSQIEGTNQIEIRSKNSVENVDFVVSSVYSKHLAQMLPSDYTQLKDQLSEIECVNMAIVNLYFKSKVLPVRGFGYLVPTKEKSPILGCIFDSVFNKPEQNNTVLTTMLGGAWFNETIGNKSNDQIYDLAYSELRKHLNLKDEPDIQEVSVLNEAIPQYKVGHPQLLKKIYKSLEESNLNGRLFLTGNTYDGIGVNDCIFGSRKLVQNVLSKVIV